MVKLRYVLLWGFLAVFLVLYAGIYGVEKAKVQALRARVERQVEEMVRLKREIARLRRELELYSTREGVEREARRSLFMVYPGEEIYVIECPKEEESLLPGGGSRKSEGRR